MSQDLKIGDLVRFAHNSNIFTGSILADAATAPDGSHNFLVQTRHVMVHGKRKPVRGFSVAYPASALELIRVDGL